jgi:hypothetical protein
MLSCDLPRPRSRVLAGSDSPVGRVGFEMDTRRECGLGRRARFKSCVGEVALEVVEGSFDYEPTD